MFNLPSSIYPFLNRRTNYQNDKQQILEIWENFNVLGNWESGRDLVPKKLVRNLVIESWKRCQTYNLDPTIHGSIKNYSNTTLKKLIKNDQVFHLAKPVINQLKKEMAHTNHAIILCNRKGVVLDVTGDKSAVSLIGNSVNVVPGSDWSERWAGTNAIGTALELNKPIHMFHGEHFAMGCHQWSCAAAPIFDPFTGETIAILNLSTLSDLINERSFLSALWGATTIEELISKEYYEAKEMLHDIFMRGVTRWKNNPVILLDYNDNVLLSNDEALKIINDRDIFKQVLPQRSWAEHEREEWETELVLVGKEYKAWIQPIFWRNKAVSKLLVLKPTQKKQRSIYRAKHSFSSLIGKTPTFRHMLGLAKKAADSDANVLITSETGTGKELLANSIHAASPRKDGPFIAVNCGAIPNQLMASELFGYVGGAFTGADPKGKEGKFALAHNGTLFLDEIGELSVELQVQLLRAIQEQEIVPVGGHEPIPADVRIIAATNKQLSTDIANGSFRQDLYYRIKVFHLELPPLRERKEDIPLLANHFIKKISAKRGKGPYKLSDDALEYLVNYRWPGNIRELENVIEFAVNVAETEWIQKDDLPKDVLSAVTIVGKTNLNPVEQAELQWIIDTLDAHDRNLSKAAEVLDMSRSTIYRKLNRYGYEIKN